MGSGRRSSRAPGKPGIRLTAALWATALLPVLLIPIHAGAATACAEENQPGQGVLTGFTRGDENATASHFYMVGESQGEAKLMVTITPSGCVPGGTRGRVDYATQDLVAAATQDYAARSGTTVTMCNDSPGHVEQYCGQSPPAPPPSVAVNVPIADDTQVETALEPFLFKLTGGTSSTDPPGGVGTPGEAPVYIVDNDGQLRFSLEPTRNGTSVVTYSRIEGYSIEIPVFRAGPAQEMATVSYSVTSIGENVAVAGTDYILPSPQQVDFPANERFSFIRINVPHDFVIDGDKMLEIELEGNVVGPSPRATTLVLEDNAVVVGDETPPETKFHHPRQGLVYKRGDYRLRTIHVFDQLGDAKRVQIALAKRTEDNRCSWFTKGRWKRGACDAPVWLSTEILPYPFKGRDLYHRDFPALKPTTGTWVKNYQAWSRAWDEAGNPEDTFTKGRNRNTFRVSRRAQ